MMLRLPLSLRLTLWYGFSMLVLLALFIGVLATTFHVHQHTLLHQRLFRAHTELLDQLEWQDGPPRLIPPLAQRRGTYRIHGPSGLYARLLAPGGRVLEQTPNLDETEAFRPLLPAVAAMREMEFTWQGHPMRAQYVPLQVDGEVVAWLEVSAWAWSFRSHATGWPVVPALALTMIGALAGGYTLARRALRPVAAMTAAARRITPRDLGERLPIERKVRDELTDLAETFNQMLARLQEGFVREQRFTDNAAHELLTPLAGIRNEVEVVLRQPREPETYRQALRDVHLDVLRLAKIVEQLLQLARLDAGGEPVTVPSDWSSVCRERVQAWGATVGPARSLHADVAPRILVAAHAEHLSIITDNLLDNAVKYTPTEGKILVTLTADTRQAHLTVSDTGAGFDAETARQLFDRFFRADTPAVQAQAGCGLGLSIVRALVEHYGGVVHAHSDGAGNGSTFTVMLPCVSV